MRIIINIVAFVAFIMQSISFVFNALIQKKPECYTETLYSVFLLTAYVCSLLSVWIFVFMYNFNISLLRKKYVFFFLLMIVLLGCYIHLMQLFVIQDFIITSCSMLLFDCYVIAKVLPSCFKKEHNELSK